MTQHWTPIPPSAPGWYVVKERMHNEGAIWDRYTALRLAQLGEMLYIQTEPCFPFRVYTASEKKDFMWLSVAQINDWSAKAPTKVGTYLVREAGYDFGVPGYRYTIKKLVRKMFRLYVATDEIYPEHRFEAAVGEMYFRLE